MRLLRAVFVSIFLGIIFANLGLTRHTQVFAQASVTPADAGVNGDKVGPELAFFDPGSQEDVCANVVRANNFGGVLAVMNQITNTPYNPCPGPNTVLRIVEIKNSTTVAMMETFAQGLNASTEFNPGTKVVVGVELNNLDEEYWGGGPSQGLANAARQYARLFNAFSAKVDHSKYKIYPAPPDLYNAVYDPKPWIAAFASSVNCGLIDALSGDIFDVTPQVPGSNLEAYKYYEQNVCGGSKKVDYFEGWGTDPSNPSLRQQLDFYVKTPLPPGVEGAATLIKNTCVPNPSISERWFYYLMGKIYDREGNEIDPDSCSTTGRRNLFVYPGIEDQVTSDDKLGMASRYMMTCAPKFDLAGAIENEDSIDKPTGGNYVSFGLRCPADGRCLIPTVAGTAYINHEQTTIPLFRLEGASVPNPTSDKRRKDDFEGFFNAPVVGGEEISTTLLANGVEKKLLPAVSSCEQTVKFLQSVKSLCDNQPSSFTPINSTPKPTPKPTPAKSPQRCILDSRIPGTNHTYVSALREWESGGYSCSTTSPSPQQIQMNEVLSKVEHTTPKAFKPAYIVRYINYPGEDPTIVEQFQSWFSPPGKTNEEKAKSRIQVTKVYVPANVAATPDDAEPLPQAGKTNFLGGLMNTIKSFFSVSQQDNILERKNQEIAGVLSTSKSVSLNPNPVGGNAVNTTRLINCPECTDQDFQSILVRRINAEMLRSDTNAASEDNLACLDEGLAGEKATDRKQTINPAGNPDPVQETGIKVSATLRAKGNPKGDNLSVRTYMLLPEEYRNVYNYEKEFSQLVFGEGSDPAFSSQKLASGDRNYKYLQLSDTKPKSGDGDTIHISSGENEGGTVGYTFGTTTVKDPTLTDQEEGLSSSKEQTTVTKTNITTLNLKGKIVGPANDFDVNPTVPGGKLARTLWEIMCHITQPFRPGQQYSEYTGFERFLKEGPAACFTPEIKQPTPTTPPILAGLSDYFKQLLNIGQALFGSKPSRSCGLVYVSKEQAEQYAAELPAILEAQKQASSSFAGWEAYFRGKPGAMKLYETCGGDQKCYDFILQTVVNTPICDENTRLNPYIAIGLAFSETGGLREQSPGTERHFGCQSSAFTSYNEGATSSKGLQCTVKDAFGRTVINPLVGPNLTQADVNACVNVSGGGAPTPQLYNSIEDGLACMITRFNNICDATKQNVAVTGDIDAGRRYGGGVISFTYRTIISILNPSRYQQFVNQCGR